MEGVLHVRGQSDLLELAISRSTEGWDFSTIGAFLEHGAQPVPMFCVSGWVLACLQGVSESHICVSRGVGLRV